MQDLNTQELQEESNFGKQKKSQPFNIRMNSPSDYSLPMIVTPQKIPIAESVTHNLN
jgi:hypothetical protein